MNPPKLDKSKLTPEQRDKLDSYEAQQSQLQALNDIADITQELLNVFDDGKKDNGKSVKEIGALLLDMRDSLKSLNEKETPEAPDIAKPIADAVAKIEKAFKSLPAPQVKVDAPVVNVGPPSVDLKGVEQAVSGLSEVFTNAIKAIPVPPKPDNSELLAAWAGISEQLDSIEKAARIKPQAPNSMKVTNPDGTTIGHVSATTPTVSSVSVTNANTSILAANTSRLGATVTNEGSAVCYLKLGAAATTTSYTLQVASGGYYEIPFGYTGAIDGITSASTAQLRVTELV